MFKVILFAASILAFNANAHDSKTIFAGYSEENITPTVTEGVSSCLGGYGAPFERCGISMKFDEISVRSLALVSDKKRGSEDIFFLVSLDTVGVGDAMIAAIKEKVISLGGSKFNLSKILISATHTHSGPDLQGLWGGVDASYKQRVIDTAAETIISSYNHREKAKLSSWSTVADVENRRGLNDVDNEVVVLDIQSKRSNQRIATLVNMSAHPTLVDESTTAWSSDFVGYLRTSVELKLKTNAIFINGVVGDAQPATNSARGIDVAKIYGNNIANKIASTAKHAKKISAKDFVYNESQFVHSVENPLILMAISWGILDMDISESMTVTTQIGVLNIGCSFKAVIFPGEALTNIGLPMKDQLQVRHKMFFGLTGDTLGYFIPQAEYGQVPGRTTEERASLSRSIGSAALTEFNSEVKLLGATDYPCNGKRGNRSKK